MGPSPPLTSSFPSRLPLVLARGTRPVSGSTRGFTSSVLHRSLQHLEPPTPISPVVYSSPPRCRLLSAEPMRPPECDDVSARASPQSSLRRASLDSARPPRSFDRSRALPPPRRAPVGSAGDAAGVTKSFRRGLPRILALGWRFGRSGTKIGGLFSPYPNLSNFQTQYPHHLEPSFNQGLSCSGSI